MLKAKEARVRDLVDFLARSKNSGEDDEGVGFEEFMN